MKRLVAIVIIIGIAAAFGAVTALTGRADFVQAQRGPK